jgi:hypothetical protein
VTPRIAECPGAESWPDPSIATRLPDSGQNENAEPAQRAKPQRAGLGDPGASSRIRRLRRAWPAGHGVRDSQVRLEFLGLTQRPLPKEETSPRWWSEPMPSAELSLRGGMCGPRRTDWLPREC